MKPNYKKNILLKVLTYCALFFLVVGYFMTNTASAQQFNVDTAASIRTNHRDTIPEITILGNRIEPVKKIITYSTFSNKISFNSNKLLLMDSYLNEGDSSLFLLCIPINNHKGFKIQIDSVYIKGNRIASADIFLDFHLYKNNKLFMDRVAKRTYYTKKRINVFVFDNGFKLPVGQSYLSFNYKFLETPFNIIVKTNKRIHGTTYSYNRGRNEFKLTHVHDDVPIFAPQVKIFCSIVP